MLFFPHKGADMAHKHKGCSGCEELSEKLEKEKEEKHNSCKEALLLHQNKISGLEKKLFAMTIAGAVATAVIGKELVDKIMDSLNQVQEVQQKIEETVGVGSKDVTLAPPQHSERRWEFNLPTRSNTIFERETRTNEPTAFAPKEETDIPSFVTVKPISPSKKATKNDGPLSTPNTPTEEQIFELSDIDYSELPPLRLVETIDAFDDCSDFQTIVPIPVPAPGFLALLATAITLRSIV